MRDLPTEEYKNQKCSCFIEIERLESRLEALQAKMINRNDELIKANVHLTEKEKAIERYRKALNGVMDNLGVPQSGYPAPVAVAYDLAKSALQEGSGEK